LLLVWSLLAVAGQLRADQRPSLPAERASLLDTVAPAFDDQVEPAAMYLQQPAEDRAAAAQPAPQRRAPRTLREANVRLASLPNMFGDLGMAGLGIVVPSPNDPTGQNRLTRADFTLPTSQSLRSVKMAENDTSLPVDRVFFNYNHFHNLFGISQQPLFPPGQPPTARQQSVDRFTLGAEKTFCDGWNSIELRMPFNGSYDTTLDAVGVDGGNIGNLAVIFKHLLYIDEGFGMGVGLGIDTPTGSDTVARIGNATYRFQNEACRLLPYFGFVYSPGDPRMGWGDGLFLSAFAQVDIATGGNTIIARNEQTGATLDIGKLNDQTLLYLDLAAGYWLYRDPCAERFTGLAAVAEVHYTTALQDADIVPGPGPVLLGNLDNRFDVVNGTIGLQVLMFDASSLRVAGVFPLGDEDHRFFDSEVQVQFNRRF
jgi:hypothetical protein